MTISSLAIQCRVAIRVPVLVICFTAAAMAFEEPDSESPGSLKAPHWTWVASDGSDIDSIVFTRSIDIPPRTQQISLRVANDFCELKLIVGEQQVLVMDDFAQAQ